MAETRIGEKVEVHEAGLTGVRGWLASGLVLALVLTATVPTTGDLGLTWDEPAYRYSQILSAQWWETLGRARTSSDVAALLEPDTLLYYWPYGRHGINFHPPLGGQLNLATHALFGRWVKDIPSRRLASVFEYALTITLGFTFLARRYGPGVGGVMAGCLLFMPRVYGDGHIAATDAPGLFLWAATAMASWKGLYEPRARRWRVVVGVLLGLSFVEKMAAVAVLVPLLAWLVSVHLPKTFTRGEGKADWLDGVLTTLAMLAPLGVAFLEILRLSKAFPAPKETNLFLHRPTTAIPGGILALPLVVWLIRRALGRIFASSPLWGRERPALETWTAVLAFAPLVGWLGNPAWWVETLPRLAHYYRLNTDRRGSLPDIHILYLGQTYLYSLPWHNAWVLIAITVPATILVAAAAGILWAIRSARCDRLPLYFLVHFLTLPALRMLPTPAHDGVRLLLPSFFFLACFAAWGTVRAADTVARRLRVRSLGLRVLAAGLVLVPSAWQLVSVHPFELSYYNELIGGPAGARRAGFELAYWYDTFNDRTIAEVERVLPRGVTIDFVNDKQEPPTFLELQTLGHIRADLELATADTRSFPYYAWLLTQDSKASSLTRLLFAMKPLYALRPPQLDGLRVASVYDPPAVARAWALNLLARGREVPVASPLAPAPVRHYAPWLGRFWGQGLTPATRPTVDETLFAWARDDPAGLRAAARAIASGSPLEEDGDASRLMTFLSRFDRPGRPEGFVARRYLHARPVALIEAVEILMARPDAVRTVLTRLPYTDPEDIGGYLDKDLRPAP